MRTLIFGLAALVLIAVLWFNEQTTIARLEFELDRCRYTQRLGHDALQ